MYFKVGDLICHFLKNQKTNAAQKKYKIQKLYAVKMVYIQDWILLTFFLSRDGNFEISKAEFGHIFLQFHGQVYLVQGKCMEKG